MYRDVSLAPDEVEWVRWPDREDVKDAAFDDHAFELFVVEHGLVGALERVTQFHREVANQLIARGVRELSTPWRIRAVVLARAVKRRRGQLRGMLAAEVGWPVVNELVAELIVRYPRAEWCSERRRP